MTEHGERTVRSFCRICTATCGIVVHVSGDQVVQVRGDRDHPLSHGYTGTAKVDPSIRRGVVSVPHGHEGANVNRLTSKDDIDLVTGMARYSGFPVTVHPAPGGLSADHRSVAVTTSYVDLKTYGHATP